MPDVIIITSPGPQGPPGPPGSGSSGASFPYTGSAIISGSLDLNGPLNVDIQNFNITNDIFTQNAIFNSSSINLNTISNQVGTLSREWNSGSLFFPPSSITSGSIFQVDGFVANPSIGTKVFYRGNQTDGYGISGYKFLGIVTDTGSSNTGGSEPIYYNYVRVRAYITTSSLGEQTYRFYNTGSGLGTINLNSNTNINGALSVNSSISSPLYLISGSEFRGSLVLNGTASINNNLQIASTLINRNNNPDPNRYTGSQKFITLGQMDPTIGSGSWSSALYSDTNFITLVRNAFESNTSFDPYAGLNTRIQFQQGTRWNWTSGEDTYTNTINNTASRLDFFTDNTYRNITELQYIGQGYNTSANQENAPLLPAKGFNTNYNGTAYFNVTGSVSASAYYGDGSNLTGIFRNPFTGSLLVSGSINVKGIITSNILDLEDQLSIGANNYFDKVITLGQPVLDEYQPANDTNYFQLYRKLDGTTTHTIFNFGSNDYWCDSENCSLSDNFGNNYLEFIQKGILLGTYPADVNVPIIDLKFNTTPYGYNGSTYLSGSSKGFSTNYNGTTYFNVTGSVSASAYYGDGSNLDNLYTTPVLFNEQTSSYTASLSDLGKMVELSSSTTINIVIPNNSTVAFPTGSQITFIQTGTQNTTFITGSGVTINSFNNNDTLTGQYSVATCVKKSTNTWYLFGDLS